MNQHASARCLRKDAQMQWLSHLWAVSSLRYPCTRSATARRRNGAWRFRNAGLWPLEVRSLLSVTAVDDVATVDVVVDSLLDFSGVDVVVLQNDLAGTAPLDRSSITITKEPDHGTASLSTKFAYAFTGFHGFGGISNDNDSPVGDGRASAVSHVVDEDGQIKLGVGDFHNKLVFGLNPFPEGDYALYVRLGVSDFSNFQPDHFDYEFRGRFAPIPVHLAFLNEPVVQQYKVDGLTPGTPYIAWIDNTIGNGTPDTVLQVVGPNVIHYEPEGGFFGTDTVRYTVRDTQGNVSNEATVTIHIVNRPPQTQSIRVETPQGTAVEFPIEATDADGEIDWTSLRVETAPRHGRVIAAPDDLRFQYVPDPGYFGPDRFTYSVRDLAGGVSNVATVTLSVINTPPVTAEDVATTARNQPVTIDVLANDADEDGQLATATLAIEAPPAHGRVVIRATANGPVMVYTPDVNYLGPDSFAYTVRDQQGTISAPTLVTINPAPDAQEDEATTTENLPMAIDVLGNDLSVAPGTTLVPQTAVVIDRPQRGTVRWEETSAGVRAVYTPNRGAAATLTVDELSDRDDGNLSAGHLSLREALRLANADQYTDRFRYAVQDSHGILSTPTTVTIDVAAAATTIQFAPGLFAAGNATLWASQIGSVADGNTAWAITSPITILGPATGRTLTIAGQGKGSDLRLFAVDANGSLTLQRLTLRDATTDGSGAALLVNEGTTATLRDCVLQGHDSFDRGGAIANLGTVSLTSCTLSNNTAAQGGAISNVGTISLTQTMLSLNRAELGGGLDHQSGIATLDRVTFQQNTAKDDGGGLFNADVVVVTHSRFEGNQAEVGGGLLNIGTATVTDTSLVNNRADRGGGFANSAGNSSILQAGQVAGTMTLERGIVTGNTARDGGGGHNLGELTMTASTLANNQATRGGGMFQSDFGLNSGTSQCTLSGSTIEKNRADDGAGLYVDLGAVSVVASTISSNVATQRGGGICSDAAVVLTTATLGDNTAAQGSGFFNGTGSVTIENCTIAANTATQGAGLDNDLGYVRLKNSIVADNRRGLLPRDIGGNTNVDLAESTHNVIGTGGSGGLKDGIENNRVGIAALLAPLATYGGLVKTFALLPGSPAIDTGTGETSDARGIAPVGPRDRGAFESRGFTMTVTGGSGQSAAVTTAFLVPLQVRVQPRAAGEPVLGGSVSFQTPATGPSAVLSGSTVVIGLSGQAWVTARANGLPGTYQVRAMASGANGSVMWTLTNRGTAIASAGGPASASPVMIAPVATTVATTPVGDGAAPASVIVAPADLPVGVDVLAADPTEYRLTPTHQLQRRGPGGVWFPVANQVVKFEKAPNGDLYLLNEQSEVRRLQLGRYWSTIRTGVRTFEMATNGTLYILDHFNKVIPEAALDRYYVLPPYQPDRASPPSDAEIVEAIHIGNGLSWQGEWQDFSGYGQFPLQGELDSTSTISETSLPEASAAARERPWIRILGSVLIVAEPIVDTVEQPYFLPGYGLVQLHRSRYHVTVYGSSLATSESVRVFCLNHDHLHRVHPTPPTISTGTPVVTKELDVPPVHPFPQTDFSTTNHVNGTGTHEQFTPQLLKGIDGTIYTVGVPEDLNAASFGGYSLSGDSSPYMLQRLTPGGYWESLPRVRSVALAKDGTLIAVSATGNLQTLHPTSQQWQTLARDVQNFALSPRGELYALQTDHTLLYRPTRTAAWKSLETGTTTLVGLADGTVQSVNDRRQLRRWSGATPLLVAPGVTHLLQIDEQLYALTERGVLNRSVTSRSWQEIRSGIHDLTAAGDGTVYALAANGDVYRSLRGRPLERIDTGVQSLQVAPNGDLYELSQRQELKRLKLGYSWSTLQIGVESFRIDDYGTAFVLDRFGRVTMYASDFRSSARFPEGPETVLATFPPSSNTVVNAIGMGGIGGSTLEYPDALYNDVQYFPAAIPPDVTGQYAPHQRDNRVSSWNNVRMNVEPLVDAVDPPRVFPNIGLAQLHRAVYKCTVYGETLIAHPASSPDDYVVNPEEVQVLIYSRDELLPLAPGHEPYIGGNASPSSATVPAPAIGKPGRNQTVPPPSAASAAREHAVVQALKTSPLTAGAASNAARPASVQRPVDLTVQSLTVAPDGTIYKLGNGAGGYVYRGSEPAPHFLWKLPPNGEWTPIDYVQDFAIDAENRLYLLDAEGVLRTPIQSPARWITLAEDVTSIALQPDGTLWALNHQHELRVRLPGQTSWSRTEAGVRALLKSPQGTVYTVTDNGALRRLSATYQWTILDLGVKSFALVADGSFYAVNGLGQLKRWSEAGTVKSLATGIASCLVSQEGVVYALTIRGEVQQLTARDHWTVLQRNIAQFQLAPNGDLYAIHRNGDLLRQQSESNWGTLQAAVKSLSITSDGTVSVINRRGETTLYATVNPLLLLPPIPQEQPEHPTPPSPGLIMDVANLRSPSQSHPYIPDSISDFAGDLQVGTRSRRRPALVANHVQYAVPIRRTVSDVGIVTELIDDRLEPSQFTADSKAVRRHRAQYKCMISFTNEAGAREQIVLFLDADHWHLIASAANHDPHPRSRRRPKS